jgi:dTDP-4-dehydrorhamnose 3,5-epimerase
MIFRDTRLPGVYEIELERHEDERGFFARAYCEREFAARELLTSYPQWNLSRNRARATLRGLHLQSPPQAEVKIVRCVRGAIFDVAVDLRPGSPGYRQWVAVELSAERGNALYIPAGCAHGFITLRDDSDVLYQMGAVHAPEAARGFRWDDPAFGIRWPLAPAVISARDRAFPDFLDGARDG